jgi:hypothetical protein
MKKFGINGLLLSKFFLFVIHRSSLVKAAMNVARICKMRNGVSKRPSISEVGKRTTFDLLPLPWARGGGGHGVQGQICHILTPASYESLSEDGG